jgi:hypothetical protein
MKYVCKNKRCKSFNKEDEFYNEIFIYENGKLIGEHQRCPECGCIREFINKDENIPLSEKNINIGRFNGMSVKDKQDLLKKRSHEHYEKKIKEKKEYLLHETVRKFKKS